ncbi:hypothetical protein AYI70_g12342 [Smittium culicis]|uniref:Uncharacterized protein n=1 Tax=Smittium culicis TaxID=133412 RepID=A0A1R1WXY7_9FUNG|nr:hypothetical protein AYI70_g12342 [Smittium culicis]
MIQQQQQLNKLSLDFMATVQKLEASSAGWEALSSKLSDSIKELGDVQNWANAIETDLQTISAEISKVTGK